MEEIVGLNVGGSDQIPGELLKYRGKAIVYKMIKMCISIWQITTECGYHLTISFINHAS